MKDKNKKSQGLKLIRIADEGKGVSKTESELPPSFKRFFLCLRNNLGKLLTLNILMVAGNFPLIFIIIALAGYTQTEYMLPLSDAFQNLGGFAAGGGYSPADMAQYAVYGMMHNTLSPTGWTYLLYGIGALSLFTLGPVNVGAAYVLRNMVASEPVFTFEDFRGAIKKNWRAALPFGIVDTLILGLLVFNVYSMVSSISSFFSSFMFWSNLVLLLVYLVMRVYIYLEMVTFDLPISKMVKNALILSLLGWKRNLVCMLGVALLLFFELFFLIGAGGLLLPFAVALPLIYLLSVTLFILVYGTYFMVKQYMIDPYLAEHPELVPTYDDEEPIMHDDVTERERLEEIKRRNGIQN